MDQVKTPAEKKSKILNQVSVCGREREGEKRGGGC